jgi:hypothetical protein
MTPQTGPSWRVLCMKTASAPQFRRSYLRARNRYHITCSVNSACCFKYFKWKYQLCLARRFQYRRWNLAYQSILHIRMWKWPKFDEEWKWRKFFCNGLSPFDVIWCEMQRCCTIFLCFFRIRLPILSDSAGVKVPTRFTIVNGRFTLTETKRL